MREVFEDLKGFEDSYQISDQGRVFSKRRMRGNQIIYGRELALQITNDNYLKVHLCKNGVDKAYYLHRLVAKQFLNNPDNLPQVNHKDGNKANNCVSNLEWCTRDYNREHAVENHLMQHGEKRPSHKLTEKDVLEIYKYKGVLTGAELGRRYGVSKNTINIIQRGGKWKYLYEQYFNTKQQKTLDNQQPSCDSTTEGSTTKELLS